MFTIYGHSGHFNVGLVQLCENLVEHNHAYHWPFDFRDYFKGSLPCMGVVAILVM